MPRTSSAANINRKWFIIGWCSSLIRRLVEKLSPREDVGMLLILQTFVLVFAELDVVVEVVDDIFLVDGCSFFF